MPRSKKPAPEKVVRRPKAERKGLSPELVPLARGEVDRIVRPRRNDPERLRDPREGYAIKGVANRDARAVYDVRMARLHALLTARKTERETSEADLGDELCDWVRLNLWRARRVTGFRSFSEDVLSQPEAELEALARQGAARAGVPLETLSERTVALWLRLEAGLLEADPSAHVRLDRQQRFVLSVALDPAASAVAAASVRVSPLARTLRAGAAPRERGTTPGAGRGEASAADERRSFPGAGAGRTGAGRTGAGRTGAAAGRAGSAGGSTGKATGRPVAEPAARGGDRPPKRRGPEPAGRGKPAPERGAAPGKASGFGERRHRKKAYRG